MTAAVLVAVITVLPLVVVAADGFGSSPAGAVDYLLRPRTAELLTNTLLLLLVTVPATVVLGVGAAWLVERTDLPLAGVWRVLLGAPWPSPPSSPRTPGSPSDRDSTVSAGPHW